MAYSHPVQKEPSPKNRSEVDQELFATDNTPTIVQNFSEEHLSSTSTSSEVHNIGDCSNMEAFFEHRKCDLLYELRNIQHGERPVTGQNHRENLQQFMKKRLCSVNKEPGKENIPSNVDSVEEHRPESVVVEVQGVFEQRPVSSVLQSVAFRRQLENIIRGSIVGASNQNFQSQRPRVRTQGPVVPVSNPTRISEQTRAERPRIERNERRESISSQDSFSSALSSVDEDVNDADGESNVARNPVAFSSTPPDASSQSSRIEPQRRDNSSPQQVAELNPNPDAAVGRLSWHDVERVQREELVEELSGLVHSHLVSSTLDGEFRATLELLVQDHVASSGSNGPAVQEFVRSLPGRGIPRNDFSHLGIAPIPENENWDNISVTSVSAHSVPYTQTNTYLSREIQNLKTQMSEMKNMLKISVDIQMDIQRAIRQEVAAAVAKNAVQGACAVDVPVSKPVSDTHCLICLDRHSDSVLYQCGHMCVCYICGKNLISRNHTCPVCRAPIKDVIRAYKTNMD